MAKKAKVQLADDGRIIIPPDSEMYEAAKAVSVRDLAGLVDDDCPLCEVGHFKVEDDRWCCSECGDEDWHGPIGFVMRRDSVDAEEAVRWLAANGQEPSHKNSGDLHSTPLTLERPGDHPVSQRTKAMTDRSITPSPEVSNLRIGSDDNAIRHEQELIGILLVEPILLDSESVEKILPRHIFRIELRFVLEAMREIHRRGEIPTIENIPEYLEKIGQPKAIELAELSMLVAKAPLTAQVDQCANEVLRNGIKRETYTALTQRLSAMAKSDGKLDTSDFIADTQNDLAKIQAQIGGAAPERLPRLLEGYHETDLGNAERLVDRYGDEILYCQSWKSWLSWDGQRWKPDDDAQVRRLAQKVARSMWNEVADKPTKIERDRFARFVKQSEGTARLNHMMIEAQAMRPVLPVVLDADPMLLNIENGVLDLRTGELLSHDPSLLMTKLFHAEYDPEAECPKWLAAIDRWTQEDKGLALYLQMALGYCLTGLTDEHCVFFPYGVGANGKTTLFETVRRMFGDYGGTIKIDALLGHHYSSAEGPSPGIVKLKGSRLVITSEVPEGRKLNASLIKDLSGGDSITARDLFRSTETFRATHKLFVIGNYKPRISDNSEGMWRRVRVIPFIEVIPKDEREPMEDLIEGFLAERSGILNWLLEGCLLWQTNRLAEPDVVQAATQEYRDEMDALLEFIGDEMVLGQGRANKKAVHGAMKAWAKQAGERDLEDKSARWLTIRLTQMGVELDKGKRDYVGIRFKTQAEVAGKVT